MKNKHFISFAIYASILIVLYNVYTQKLYQIPEIVNSWYLLISFIFLFSAFMVDGFLWHKTLAINKILSNVYLSYHSSGSTVLTKYIPGKVVFLFSRASIISEHTNRDTKDVGLLVIFIQIISLLTGLLLSFFVISQVNYLVIFLIVSFFLTLIFILIFFDSLVLKFGLSKKKKHFEIQKYSSIFGFCFAYWLLITFGFTYLVASITNELNLALGVFFCFSANVGIIIFLSPGGIGIREGLLTYLLLLEFKDLEFVLSISILSRMWFLVAESLYFGVGFLSKYLMSKTTEKSLE